MRPLFFSGKIIAQKMPPDSNSSKKKVEHPDVAAFRAKVAGLQNMKLYSDPKVHALLLKFMEATK